MFTNNINIYNIYIYICSLEFTCDLENMLSRKTIIIKRNCESITLCITQNWNLTYIPRYKLRVILRFNNYTILLSLSQLHITRLKSYIKKKCFGKNKLNLLGTSNNYLL